MPLSPMKTNDALLRHFIQLDASLRNKKVVSFDDEFVATPKEIDVQPNEVVYIHCFHASTADFSVRMVTPTKVVNYQPKTTVNGSSNQLVKCLGSVQFKAQPADQFAVQYLKVRYEP